MATEEYRKDFNTAFKTISAKVKSYTDLFGYYDGDAPLMYSTQQLVEVFRSLDAKFTLNVCSVVIDATKERISFQGFSTGDKDVDAKLSDLVVQQDLKNEADETHEAALVCGEAYIIVWPEVIDGQETAKVEVFYNDPRNVHVFYDPANPRKPIYAAKLWMGDDGKSHMTLYYADRLEYYVTTRVEESESLVDEKSFIADISRSGVIVEGDLVTWPKNPYGAIPVFHYQIEKRCNKSDIKNVVPLQNGINKLMSDMMVAAEYGAFKQRWIITNASTETLKNNPNAI